LTDTTVFEREQQELAAGGKPDMSGLVGQELADYDLVDPYGKPTTLSAAVGKRPAVLVLYRGAWCPFCNLVLHGYQTELLPVLMKRDIGLIAVSPQLPDGSLTIKEKQGLTFTVVSDPGNRIAADLGVLTSPSEEAREAQLGMGLDLQEVNADGTTTLPLPTVVILDPDLTIRWIDVRPDYSDRTTVAEIVAALDELDL
jgi:peroxiredoxin